MLLKMVNRMKQSLLLSAKRLLYYLGFSLERIPDENQFFNELHTASDAIQKYLLKKRASKNRAHNNHTEYNKLIKRFVPDWDITFTRTEFVGHGIGEHNLGVYRKVYFDDKYYFEKVYFNDSFALKKNKWICNNGHSILSNYLNTPKLCKVIKGDLISVAYFDFIDFVHLPEEERINIMFNISRKMFNITKDFGSLFNNAPGFLKDYRLHEYYELVVNGAEKMIKELSGGKLTVNMIERVIARQPLIFTHGDMHAGNVFSDNYIIDWDVYGFFPRGLESAAILATSGKTFTLKKVQEILFQEYSTLIRVEEWDDFELTCLYFYLIFTVIHEKSSSTIALQKDLFGRVEELHKKIIYKIL